MWIVCWADKSHEMSRLIFSGKQNTRKKKKQKKKKLKMPSVAVVISTSGIDWSAKWCVHIHWLKASSSDLVQFDQDLPYLLWLSKHLKKLEMCL